MLLTGKEDVPDGFASGQSDIYGKRNDVSNIVNKSII